MVKKIIKFFTQGNERSIKAKKNILGMLFLKGGNILIGLLLIPTTLGYVNNETYGIWIALSSMISWISFFDIGISNGLKNKLTTALAQKNYPLCRKYISTTYAILTLIFIPLMILLLSIAPLINWNHLLNLTNIASKELLISICIVISYFCINFILSTINTIILAEQQPADAALRTFIQQLVSLIVIYILTLTSKGNLIILCIAFCFSPLLTVLIFNISLFKGRFKAISPQLSAIDFKVAPDLMKLGIQFFIIQIAAVIQYQMVNFLILRYYGASEVTSYNIAFKYFNIITMIWGILTSPLWVAVTDAIAKNDYNWIFNTQKKYLKIYSFFILIGFIMLLISSYIYALWIGEKVIVPFGLSLWVLIYNLSMMLASLFVLVLNGSGILKLQTYASIFSPLIFIISCYIFISNDFPLYGILISAILSNFNGLIIAPIQCYKIKRNFCKSNF